MCKPWCNRAASCFVESRQQKKSVLQGSRGGHFHPYVSFLTLLVSFFCNKHATIFKFKCFFVCFLLVLLYNYYLLSGCINFCPIEKILFYIIQLLLWGIFFYCLNMFTCALNLAFYLCLICGKMRADSFPYQKSKK